MVSLLGLVLILIPQGKKAEKQKNTRKCPLIDSVCLSLPTLKGFASSLREKEN